MLKEAVGGFVAKRVIETTVVFRPVRQGKDAEKKGRFSFEEVLKKIKEGQLEVDPSRMPLQRAALNTVLKNVQRVLQFAGNAAGGWCDEADERLCAALGKPLHKRTSCSAEGPPRKKTKRKNDKDITDEAVKQHTLFRAQASDLQEISDALGSLQKAYEQLEEECSQKDERIARLKARLRCNQLHSASSSSSEAATSNWSSSSSTSSSSSDSSDSR